MKQSIIFAFHFNQAVTPYTKIADEVCYKGLLAVLRRHRDTKFTIHISGTLIESLLEYNSTTLNLIKKGIADAQFEILGSTYAQNVMYSTDDVSNQIQIELHRKVLKDVFNFEPIGFWIPERCWRKGFTKILTDNGYKYTFIEKHILRQVKSRRHLNAVYPTSCNNLVIFPDDEIFRHKVNFAIWSGIKEQVFEYLNTSVPQSISPSIVVYAEDAETSGLWGYENGTLPQIAWKNLDNLISTLKQKFNFTTAKDFLSLTRLPPNEFGGYPLTRLNTNGQADWMVRSARVKEAPYHEDGFMDWFDFNLHSEKIQKFRKLFKNTAKKLEKLENKILKNPILYKCNKLKTLLEYSKKIFASHQYEFGCIGIGEKVYLPFSGIKNSLIPLKALFTKDGCFVNDINEDGIKEIIIKDNNNFFVFSRYGGRLLYWYDLKNGCEIVGSSTVPRNPKNSENDNLYIQMKKIRKVSDVVYQKDIEKYKKEIAMNDSWFKWYINGEIRGCKKFFQYNCPQNTDLQDYYPPQRCLNDFAVDGELTILEPNFIYKFDSKNLTFKFENEFVNLRKKIFLKDNGLDILYGISCSRHLNADYNYNYNAHMIKSFREKIKIFEFPFLRSPLQRFYISLTKT